MSEPEERSIPSSRSSRVQVIKHRNRSFVTGLMWHPLGSITNYMREAREYGRKHNLDIVAIRRTTAIIQAGFVSRTDGVTRGMYSLAATLAGQLGNSWIAAWPVELDADRFAIVAVHKGAVIPGCDLIATESEVRRRIAQQRSRGIVFEAWYMPDGFGVPEPSTPLDVDGLLSPKNLRREYRLRPLVFGLSKAELAQLAIIGGVIAAGLYGWHLYSAHQEEIERQARVEAERARLEELARLEQEAGHPQSAQALEHPWAKQPSVTSFLKGCSAIIYQLPLSIRGWMFTASRCDGVAVVASYRRTGNSTSLSLLESVKPFVTGYSFDSNHDVVTLNIALSLPAAGDEDVLPSDVAIEQLSSWLHAFSQVPTFTSVPVASPVPASLPGQAAPPPAPAPQWSQYQVRYESLVMPFDALNGAPSQGFRLREITAQYQGQHLTWSVTGDLYAQ